MLRHFVPAMMLLMGLMVVLSAGCGRATNTVAPSNADLTIPDPFSSHYSDPDRALFGLWYLDFKSATVDQNRSRTANEHINFADALLMPEYLGALEVEIENFSEFGQYAPPAVQLNIKLNNYFGVTGWNVRGIFLDDTGQVALRSPDGYTNQWDDGGTIKVNPFVEFCSIDNGAFPDGTSAERTCILECPSNDVPAGLWFAADTSIDGAVKSARSFQLSAINGTFRWPNDTAELVAKVNGNEANVSWVAALSGLFAGGPTFLDFAGMDGIDRLYTGDLHYKGGLGHGEFPLYFVAWSDNDIPTLGSTIVYVDPGPFATGPADTGCSQANYDAARTCRTKGPVSEPQTDWVLRDPPSDSGIVLAPGTVLVRILEYDHSIVYQHAGVNYPVWSRFYESGDKPTTPAVGNDGTIFYLEQSMGRLRAVRPDGTDRWKYDFNQETGSNLLLTSSPYGGLLIATLRRNDFDTAIVAIRTDGHLQWKYDLWDGLSGEATDSRLAVAPGNKTVFYALPTGGVLALSIDGQPLWSVSHSDWTDSYEPVAGDDDRVFIISSEGNYVSCITADGNILWNKHAPGSWAAKYPSLDYEGNYFVTAGIAGIDTQNNRVFKYDGNDGSVLMTVNVLVARGYVVHDPNGDFLNVTELNPNVAQCEDFFNYFTHEGVNTWWVRTPGFTKTGAYPVVDTFNNIYVQGPDGTYIVM